MSISSRATAALLWPLPTMSKACSSGTPDFIMVASWRVNSVMSLSVMLPPRPSFCFLISSTLMPWRRSVALTWASPVALISPRTVLLLLSLPTQVKLNSLMSDAFLAAAVAVAMI